MGKKFKGMYMQKCGLRDGSLVPVTALLAQGLTDSSLKYHLQNAKNHGVTQKEIAAVITHAAFYAGWPKAWAVFNLAKEVWKQAKEICHTKRKGCVRMQKRWYFQLVHQMIVLHSIFRAEVFLHRFLLLRLEFSM